MHVAEHKQMRGRGIIDFRLFLKIRRHQDARQGRWLAVDRFAQVVAARRGHVQGNAVGCFHTRFVCRTTIDGDGAAVREGQAPLGDRGRDVITRISGAPGVDGAETRSRPAGHHIANKVVWRKAIGMVERIQVAADLELFEIA